MKDNRREQLLAYVKKEFIGPDPIDKPGFRQENGEEILYSDTPLTRYIAGILFPLKVTDDVVESAESSGTIPPEEDAGEEIRGNDKQPGNNGDSAQEPYSDDGEDELIDRSNAYKPSAFSITAALKQGDHIRIKVDAGAYTPEKYLDEKGNVKPRYLRRAIHWESGKITELPSSDSHYMVFNTADSEPYLRFAITYRYHTENSRIYTFTLLNAKQVSSSKKTSFKNEDCYFQTGFRIDSEKGFAPLPESKTVGNDEDRLSNQLLYRNVHTYAIGHGISADWENIEKVSWIKTSILPSYEIRPIVPNTIDNISLSMYDLSDHGDFEKGLSDLKKLCDTYESWIDKTHERANELPDKYRKIADQHIISCNKCLQRMKNGIQLLINNEQIRTAFQLANRAMLMQQLHYRLPLQKWKVQNDDHAHLEKIVNQMPEVDDESTWYGDHNRYNHWYPFQIAFILMNLEAMYDDYSPERQIVDLIWFPTGGGKTEAYLGLSAYTIFLRRIKNKDDSGTAIIMRYTLRLLTAQQYQRAAAMICCCEVIRREKENILGESPISIGLWVGSANTPNHMSDALEKYDDIYSNPRLSNPFVIRKCPWCGAEMTFLDMMTESGTKSPGYRKIPSKPRGKGKLIYQCGNSEHDCMFSSKEKPLPLYIVDDSIYKNTPTMIIGTVDKFATLPARPEARSIFGLDENGKRISAPSLIIQDELHLISGPLGSMVGIYETLIHEICTFKGVKGNFYPKIVASTATISHAKEQCSELYGCKTDQVFQFPPAGIDYSDSFFACEDKSPETNGRLYVGILADGASSDAITSIYLYSSLLYGAKAMNVEGDEKKRDPYWTIVGYYNSIRELGTAETWIHDDIEHHLDTMYRRQKFRENFETSEDYQKARRYIWRSEELTSRIQSTRVTESLSHLELKYPQENGEYPIDICMATNMISVGLDVQRLGLMTVTGQPKTTSEYIQATSRVGRDYKNAPGIVFVTYRPGKPRDKSHYEQFRSYHSKIYTNVEPTSVTPFAEPVRRRALHAILFSMIRLEGDKKEASDPPMIPEKETLEHYKKVIRERVQNVDPQELDATMEEIELILQDWKNWQPQEWYAVPNKANGYSAKVPLMFPAGTVPNKAAWGEKENGDPKSFETPNSMRSVDAECRGRQMANPYKAKGE